MQRLSAKVSASILPNYWQGERGCVVGPFPSREVARTFLSDVLHANHVQVRAEDIVARGNAYYIEIGVGALSRPRLLV